MVRQTRPSTASFIIYDSRVKGEGADRNEIVRREMRRCGGGYRDESFEAVLGDVENQS